MIDIQATIKSHLEAIGHLPAIEAQIGQAAEALVDRLRKGGKVLWMGNGGSAADSQHMAAELVGRYNRERGGLASIALTTDSSILTSIANDYGFETIFTRQIEALCRPSDAVIGISTSGNSANVISAIAKAREIGAFTIGLAGRDGGQLATAAELCITIPVDSTARIQEAHVLIGHILCDWVEEAFAGDRGGA